MKIKSGFVLHSMGSENVVVAVEERTAEFRGMIRLNDTGAFLWKCLEKESTEASLAAALVREYDIAEETAKAAVASFAAQLSAAGVLEL